jgi:hypothetical protein
MWGRARAQSIYGSGYRLDVQVITTRFPAGVREIYLFPKAPTPTQTPTQLPTQKSCRIFSDSKVAVAWIWPLIPSSAEVTNEWSCNSAPSYAIVLCRGTLFLKSILEHGSIGIQIYTVTTSAFAGQQERFEDQEGDKRTEDYFGNSLHSCRNRYMLAFWCRSLKKFVIYLQFKKFVIYLQFKKFVIYLNLRSLWSIFNLRSLWSIFNLISLWSIFNLRSLWSIFNLRSLWSIFNLRRPNPRR